MLRAFFLTSCPMLVIRFLHACYPESHGRNRTIQAPSKPRAPHATCARLAVFPIPPRQVPPRGARGAGVACIDCADVRYRYSARRMVHGDAARGDRRLAASRQYPQKGGGTRGGNAAWRVARAWADSAAIGYALDHDHVFAA